MSAFGDPLIQASFSIFENKGVFALLLGSGISRAAEIPTGWEITVDLIRRVATAKGIAPQENWEKWYVETEGKSPDYSELLAQLASTPAERRAILHDYIEPTEEDREEGRKMPTKAHRAIAELVRDGFVKVIVTTNFDRLLENALREVGVEPTIISSVDALLGAEPLTHSSCYLFKIHGDYKDARILNTDEELESYPPQYNSLLDRIFDEYGLLVCGWSGEWDQALRASITRAPNRRYPLFWSTRGELKGRAKELCDLRKGIEIPINDADSFFENMLEQVKTLSESRRQNPLGIEVLLSRAKRYLSKPEFQIQISDLLRSEIDRAIDRLDGDDLSPNGQFSKEEYVRRVHVYESASEGLAKICGLIGRWGKSEHLELVSETMQSLLDHAYSERGGVVVFLNLRSYPAVLAFQACAMALIKSRNWEGLRSLLTTYVDVGRPEEHQILEYGYPLSWRGNDRDAWNNLPNFDRRYTPLSDYFYDVLFRSWSPDFLGTSSNYTSNFLLSELLPALVAVEPLGKEELAKRMHSNDGRGRGYHGMYVGRGGWDVENMSKVLKRFENEDFLEEIALAGFCGGDKDFITLAIENYKVCAGNRHWY